MTLAVPTPEALKARWANVAAVAAVLSTVALSAALLLAGKPPIRLVVLWLGCFPAVWLALRIVGAIAWDTSFKPHTRMRVPASPSQVFLAEIASLVAMLAVHGLASWAWTLEGFGTVILFAWIFYAGAALVISVIVYLPALLLTKLLVSRDCE